MNPIGELSESKILNKKTQIFFDFYVLDAVQWKTNDKITRKAFAKMIDGYMTLTDDQYPLDSWSYENTICDESNNNNKLIEQNSFIFDIYFKNKKTKEPIRVRVKLIKNIDGKWIWDYTDQLEFE